MELIPQLPTHSLLLTDRGYPSYKVFSALVSTGCRYLVRMPRGGTFGVVREFIASSEVSKVVTIQHNRHFPDPVSVRLLRVSLPEGGEAVLLTNLLDESVYLTEELCDLYRSRWSIETAFKEMKVTHVLESSNVFHVAGFHQHVAVIKCYMLMSSWLEAVIRKENQELTKGKKSAANQSVQSEYTLNRSMILRAVTKLMQLDPGDKKAMKKRMHLSIREIWRYKQRKRPGRKATRDHRLHKR